MSERYNELLGPGYDIWDVDHFRLFQVVRMVCLSFHRRPDDQTLDLLKQSSFMYGWFEGEACWHAVWTKQTRGLAEDIARGSDPYDPDPDTLWNSIEDYGDEPH